MSRNASRKSSRRENRFTRNKGNDNFETIEITTTLEKKVVQPIKGRTDNQRKYIQSIRENIITFGIGAQGTGKTYVAAGIAADMLRDKKIDRIILTRPAVEAGEKFGFLPGELDDKFKVYMEPFIDVFNERLGKSTTEYMIKHGRIAAKPIAFMRSMTFKDALIILDESQNTTPEQMKLVLTRLGDNCQIIICGDTGQKDIRSYSGLADAIKTISHLPSVGVVEFDMEDCVRSGIVKEILRAYAA